MISEIRDRLPPYGARPDPARFSINSVQLGEIKRDFGNNMGVRHFDWFARLSVPNGFFRIDMEKEIRDHVNASGTPMIVVDLISLLTPLSKHDEKALPFGGRFNLAYSVVDEFFRRLKNLGVELAFFCYGSVQEPKDEKWCVRQEGRYERNLRAFDDVDAGICVENFIRLHPYFLNLRFPLTKVAKKYGLVKMVSSKMFSRELATYASQFQALAILSTDSDFLMFEGSWRYWSSNFLELSTLNTMEYNRSGIIDYLGLDLKQMPWFATLCGNNFMPFEIVRKLHAQLGLDRDKFFNVASFIREVPISSLQEIDIVDLLKFITNHEEVDEELVKKFKQSLDVYNLNTNMENVSQFGDPVLDALSRDDSPFSFLIWQTKTLDVAIGDVDLRNPSYDYAQLLISLIVRMAGIILFYKKPQRPTHCSVLIKLNHESLHQENRFPVQYPPETEPPTLLELLSRDPEVHLRLQDIKFHLLAWIISDTLQPDRFQQIPQSLRHTVCTLYYLVQQNALKLFEADLFLQVAYDVIFKTYDPHSVEYPTTIEGRPYRTVFLYQKVHAYTAKAFRLLGVKSGNDHHDGNTFDGVLFHKRYDEWSRGLYDLDHIKHMRIYEELVDASNNRKEDTNWCTVERNRRKNHDKNVSK